MNFPRRLIDCAVVTVALIASIASPALSESATCDDKHALGLERIVEIDSKDGPGLGNLQYKAIDFLKPGEIVLTFDDGPSPQTTPRVLETLSAHCTKATFFMVGRMAVAAPELVRKVDSLGHTVASHTWSHKNLSRLSQSAMEREIELGLSAITASLGKPIAPFFRFPYLNDPKRARTHLEERDQAIFSIDVDSYDWRSKARTTMHNNVLSQLEKRGKGIILFHDIQRVTASSLNDLLDELKRRKFKVVHLIPKRTAATLAAYDEIAGKELARRKVAAASQPLTTRSMVWPMAGKDPIETVARPGDNVELPWKKPDSPQVAATAADANDAATERPAPHRARAAAERRAPPPRERSRPEELPWQEQMFQHYR